MNQITVVNLQCLVVSKGNYVTSSGGPSMTATHTPIGLFRVPATNKPLTINVMDMWRRGFIG